MGLVMVFECLRAEVDKIEIYLAGDLIADVFGDVNAAWLSQGLEPRRDVDAIAKDIARLDDDLSPRLIPMRRAMRCSGRSISFFCAAQSRRSAA